MRRMGRQGSYKHGRYAQRSGTVYGGVYLGSGCDLTQVQRDALDTLGRYYSVGVLCFQEADIFGRMVKGGFPDHALEQAAALVEKRTLSATQAA